MKTEIETYRVRVSVPLPTYKYKATLVTGEVLEGEVVAVNYDTAYGRVGDKVIEENPFGEVDDIELDQIDELVELGSVWVGMAESLLIEDNGVTTKSYSLRHHIEDRYSISYNEHHVSGTVFCKEAVERIKKYAHDNNFTFSYRRKRSDEI